jgi:hypothetical protein
MGQVVNLADHIAKRKQNLRLRRDVILKAIKSAKNKEEAERIIAKEAKALGLDSAIVERVIWDLLFEQMYRMLGVSYER